MFAIDKKTGVVTTGLCLMELRTTTELLGAPTLTLHLVVDTPNRRTKGYAVVRQAVPGGVPCESAVTGVIIFETVMPPAESVVRFDVTGYSGIVTDPPSAVPPLHYLNFRAMVLLDPSFERGKAAYEYLDREGHWHAVSQPVERVVRDPT